MRNRFMITISDIHGTKQYTMHQLIRKLAVWIIVGILLIIALGALFINLLSAKVDKLDEETRKYQHVQQLLLTQNLQLQKSKKRLEEKIKAKGEELALMDQQLSEIEKIIGIQPDISDAFDSRLATAKAKSLQRLDAAKLTVAELSLLNRSVPTGLPLKRYKHFTDYFGYRIHPILKTRTFHFGLDISADSGTPVYAPADGVVEYAKWKKGYGNFMLVTHPFGFKTAYGHLKKFAKREGDIVKKGDLIAYVGNTGRSTGAHLHYEVRYLYKWLNPMEFVKWSPKTYRKVMQKERLVHWKQLLELLKIRYTIDSRKEDLTKG
jgi:murein DD-endopeptidase MepM/ murein hydrolase activator NlpD